MPTAPGNGGGQLVGNAQQPVSTLAAQLGSAGNFVGRKKSRSAKVLGGTQNDSFEDKLESKLYP